MKRFLAGLCAAALLLSLTACSGGTSGGSTEQTPQADVTFTFSDSAIAPDSSDSDYEIDGTALTIQSPGVYALTGSCANGSVKVKKGTTGVTLLLNGLTLCGGDTAAITCAKSSAVTIQAVSGSTNILSDTAENNDDNYPENDNAENAVIKCKDGSQVTLCGSGSLSIQSLGKNGIKSGCSTDEEGEAWLLIRELTLDISSSVNDAVNAEQSLTVESGTLTISAADDALHSDLALTIGAQGTVGPTITITNCYEGIEGANLSICSGTIAITAQDDCLNAANSDLENYAFTMDISGGSIVAYTTEGDGFDSNGSLTISGGSVSVWTSNSADNQPLDADGAITISGGTVLAAGGSNGMGLRLEATQPCLTFSGLSLRKDNAFTISGEKEVYSGTALCDASFLLYSAPELTAQADYTLSYAAQQTAQAQSGSISAQGGMMQPGGMDGGMDPFNGQLPDGMEPPEGMELPDGQEPPEGMPGDGTQPPELPGGQQPGGDGTQPPAKPET